MKGSFRRFLLAVLCAGTCSTTRAQITLLTELKHFSISDLPAYRDSTIVEQQSTYDLTGGNNDGFSGTYSFVRRNTDSSLVLLDIDGPGEINRFATPTPTTDTLDFYIDNPNRPTLSVAYPDLFSGKVYPFVAPLSGAGAGGYYTYFPILFQRHCRIVSRGHKEQFHQIQYRLFPASTRVHSFTGRLSAGEETALRQITAAWSLSVTQRLQRLQRLHATTIHFSAPLVRGGHVTVLDIDRGGRLLGFSLSLASVPDAGQVAIRIYWDDEARPAVNCPVADFFGFAFGQPSMGGLLIGTDSGRCYSLLPMPFDHRARLELVDLRQVDNPATPIPIDITVYASEQARNPAREGRFNTQWARDTTTDGRPWQLAGVQGKGHYIGTVLTGKGFQPGVPLFWEGDDSTVADGRMTIHGTGTEDYFNGGWYALKGRWDTARSFPLSGCLAYSTPLCRTGGYRFYLNDKLPFTHAFLEAIEHGPQGNHIPAVYTSVAYFYADRPQ
jgi:hypothetical protein